MAIELGSADTRREALVRSVLCGSAVLASLAGRTRPASAASPAGPSQPGGDSAALAPALDLERAALALYEDVPPVRSLHPALLGAARVFAEHAREHVETLVAILHATGEVAPAPSPRAPSVPPATGPERTSAPASRSAFLRRAIELETRGLGAYLDAQGMLDDARLLQRSASAMASKSQHLVVLRQAAGLDPVPAAFVTGGRDAPFVNRPADRIE